MVNDASRRARPSAYHANRDAARNEVQKGEARAHEYMESSTAHGHAPRTRCRGALAIASAAGAVQSMRAPARRPQPSALGGVLSHCSWQRTQSYSRNCTEVMAETIASRGPSPA